MTIKRNKVARDSWNSRIGMVLAATGCAVGLGNFLRFPGIAARNGGGAFMIPYLVAFVFLALPICWIEWSMGRLGGAFGHGTAPGVFDAVAKRRYPKVKYLGVLGITGALGIFLYYVYIESWTLAYSVFALTGKYSSAQNTAEMGDFLNSFLSGQGSDFNSRTTVYVFFLITFASNFLIIYRGISRGIEKFCKIAMPLLFLMALVMVIRVFTLKAPVNPEWTLSGGLGFLWNPDLSALKSGKVWLEAAGQVFFSTSVGIGVLLTYATYMKRHDDIILSSTTASILNTFVEVVLGASIIIPAAYIFFGPVATAEAVTGGSFGLAFKTTPLIFNHMAWGGVLGCVWFILLFIAGATSAISMLQPGVAFLEEEFGFDRKRSVILLGGGCFLLAHVVIFGNGVLDEMDFWFSSFGLPLFALFEVLVFIRFFDKEEGWEELHKGALLQLPKLFKPVIRYITPLILIAILLGWLATDGWKTILMVQSSPEGLIPLYAREQLGWVIATRLFYIFIIVFFCWLIKYAWKKRKDNYVKLSDTDSGERGTETLPWET